MKASDYIMQYLHHKGVTHIYEVIGGMITHLIDSAYQHGQLKLVSTHHEQAAAFAADATGRITGVPGVAMATSGPGAINLLTGIGSCFFDSAPGLFITGQVNLSEQRGDRRVRQLGFQETDIVSMAQAVTKAAWAVKSVEQIPSMLEEAFRLATTGRPGPVLMDIPMDIQRMDLPEQLSDLPLNTEADFDQPALLDEIFTALDRSERPLILVGGGIHAARAIPALREFVDLIQIPVVNSLMAVDVLPYDHPLRVGLIGSYGNRWANMAIGTCDLLLVLGSRLDIRQTGADVAAFQSGRKIFHVDCESGEINNRIQGCYPVVSDLRPFLAAAIEAARGRALKRHSDWSEHIDQLREEWPDVREPRGNLAVNPNQAMHEISAASREAAAYVVDVGNHQMWAGQSIETGPDQHFMTSGGMGSMGFSLPAAVGASFALPGRTIVQITGDGGMQMNIQELQTVVHHKLPIKMVVFNNQSYGMVRQFQQSYFHDRFASTDWGYSAPDFSKVASAYGIRSDTVSQDSQLRSALENLWEDPFEPFLLEIRVDKSVNAYPKIAFGYPITEMEPFAKPRDMEGT